MKNYSDEQLRTQLSSLRDALLALKADGPDGFEGLIRIALTALTGVPFRLASSGLQGGVDGAAALPADAVYFEAKRYGGTLGRDEVLVKIADFSRNYNMSDRLWVLAATVEVREQLVADVRADGDKNSISTIVLDWSPTQLPFLAVVIVSGGEDAIQFILDHGKTGEDGLRSTFAAVEANPNFAGLRDRIKADFSGTKLAVARAVELSAAWRDKVFKSSRAARRQLGQPLAILEDCDAPDLRRTFREKVLGHLQAGNEVVLTGDEGQGKSWVAAQLCSEWPGLVLFVSAERFDGIKAAGLDEFLIDLLIEQTGAIADEALEMRWRHRLKAWTNAQPVTPLLIVVDGINQRQDTLWWQLLNGLQGILESIGGRLVVTVRPHYWQRLTVYGLDFKPVRIVVPNWTGPERDALLAYYDIDPGWLDSRTRDTVKNPRLLGVAIRTLGSRGADAWRGLTTDRLLFEHLLAAQRDGYEGSRTFRELTEDLRIHAGQVMERIRASSNRPPREFEGDAIAVVETRFYVPIPGPGGGYELREEGLSLALGISVVDQLWQAERRQEDLGTLIAELIQPVGALDRTVDVCFAALWVCALDEVRFSSTIFQALLDAFADLQNVSDVRFDEFVEIQKLRVDEFFEVVKRLALEHGRRVNTDWFQHGAFAVARDTASWPVAKVAIRHWLRCYNKDPAVQAARFHRRGDAEYEKQLGRARAKVGAALTALSPFEERLLEQMEEVAGDTDDLHSLALKLLAGRQLAEFADDFVAMGMGFALNHPSYQANKAFAELTTFNREDRVAVREAFPKAIESLQAESVSEGGRWTVVRMLYATGDESHAVMAEEIATELRKDWPIFDRLPQDHWRNIDIADPKASDPVGLDDGVQQFCELEPDTLWQAMGLSSEDHRFREFLPVAARFAPEAAVVKVRDILAGLLTREGFPLRQVLLNCSNDIPLVTPDLAIGLVSRIVESDAVSTLPDDVQDTCRMRAFWFAAEHLSAEDQLSCMTSGDFGRYVLVDVFLSLKTHPAETLTIALSAALDKGDEQAIYAALVAALQMDDEPTARLEELVLRCTNYPGPELRGLAFQLALNKGLSRARKAQSEGDWTASAHDGLALERVSGSHLLIEACAAGELSIDDLLRRIDQESWFDAAERLGVDFALPMIEVLLHKLRGAMAEVANRPLPPFELTLSRSDDVLFTRRLVEEMQRDAGRLPKQQDLSEVFASDDVHTERRERLATTARSFLKELDATDARLLLQRYGVEDLRRLVAYKPSLLVDLCNLLDATDDGMYAWLRNLAMAVACIASIEDPNRSVALFARAGASARVVRQSAGDRLDLEHMAVWRSVRSEPIESLWKGRLLGAENDAVLAQEVLAAERFGAATFIDDFVRELVSRGDSLDLAYAWTIVGFSSRWSTFEGDLKRYSQDKSFVGEAARNAIAARRNADWAKYWAEKMWQAPAAEDFWRCMMVAQTCMDGRISQTPSPGSKWTQFARIFRDVRRKAIKSRIKEREKTLIGQSVPEEVFVVVQD